MNTSTDTARLRAATYAVWRAEALAHDGGAVEEFDGLLCWSSGVPVRYWNGAFVTAAPGAPDQALRRTERWFTDRGMPYGVLVPVELEPLVAGPAAAAGLQRTVVQRCMALRAGDFVDPGGPPAGLEVRRTGPADVEDFLAVQVEAFESEPVGARRFLAPPVGRAGWTHLTGYLDGAPVVTAIGVHTPDAIGVYGVGTTVAGRRRGFGAALTAAVLRDGFGCGATFAHLNPSELGARTYHRLGFREVGGFAIWVPPDPRS
ncbi:MAG: GNAT family N-acetyltransferase [Marmoricola sp.]